MGTRVTALVEQGDEVQAFAGEQSLGRFDLVVGADGNHSAAVLADELGRTDARGMALALKHYETRRRKRAEGAQTASRRIAALMFVKSTPVAWGRDQLMKFYSIEEFAKEIEKSLSEPI